MWCQTAPNNCLVLTSSLWLFLCFTKDTAVFLCFTEDTAALSLPVDVLARFRLPTHPQHPPHPPPDRPPPIELIHDIDGVSVSKSSGIS